MADTQAQDTRSLSWYSRDPPHLSPSTRRLLETYAGIAPDQVEPHVLAIRERAWDVFPYPCVGQWRFLELAVGDAPQYAEVLRRVKGGQKLLDLGCCFGQDVRKLVADGAPAENCAGSDLKQEFIDLGYELFRDRGRSAAEFVVADALDEESALRRFDGRVDIVHASSFFHLFDGPTQAKLARRCLKLLRRGPGAMIFGRQIGAFEPGEKPYTAGKGSVYRHNAESFREFWRKFGEETGTGWRVEVEEIVKPGRVPTTQEEELTARTLMLRYAVYLE